MPDLSLLLATAGDIPQSTSNTGLLVVAVAGVVGLIALAALYLGARSSGGGRHRAADRPSYLPAPVAAVPAGPVPASLDDTVLLGRHEQGWVVWDVLDSHGGGGDRT